MNIRKATTIAASMLMLIVFVNINDDAKAYIASIKYGAQSEHTLAEAARTEAEKRQLYEHIKAEAEKRKISPVDARIDRVWKAIPGYNGLEVDIERTYKAALKMNDTSKLIYFYREVEPGISLKDLGPHPIYKGNPNKRMISLMINVAWGNEYIDPMLQTLEREGVKATFFFDGSWLKKNEDVAKKIQAAGHELSNHAYSHPNMSQLSRAAAYEEIQKTEQLLKSTYGVDNKWFAPPSGDFNQATVEIAEEQGLKLLKWTIDTVDWRNPPPDAVIRKISSKLEPGALILMHPTATARDALSGIIAAARKQGYAIGTVSETLSSARLGDDVVGADIF